MSAEDRSFTVASRSARETIRVVADGFVEFEGETFSEDLLDWGRSSEGGRS